MRTTLTLLTFLVALTPLAGAQSSAEEDDGCVRTDPCPWVVDVNASGFESYIEAEMTVTLGDWYELLVFNDDADRSHTISLSGHDVSVTVPADGMSDDTGAFQFNTLGDFTLKDQPSGDTIAVHVIADDAVAAEEGASSSSAARDGAAFPFVLLAVALVALVIATGRRD